MAFLNSRVTAKQGMCLMLSICFLGLILPADAKNLSFQLPSSDKLSDGDSPQSVADKEKQEPINTSLAPVSLHDDEQAQARPDNGDSDILKSTITQTDFKSKSKAGSGDKNAVASGAEESVIDKKELGDKLIGKGKGKKAKQAPNVGPIALNESDDEAQAKVDATVEAEKHQLGDLWQCTINRNPDILFVIQKLQPNSDANHAMASTMKFLTATLCGALNMAPFMLPGGVSQANPMTLMGMGSGSGLIQGLFQDKAVKGAKKQAISQEQATILYKIVRDTADKLVASYRDYKREQTSVDRASSDLSDLKSMVAESRQGQDPVRQIEMEYTLRKAKRDIDEKLEQERLYRQQLADLAGTDAIAKLDKELLDEHTAVELLTGIGGDTTKVVDGPFVNPLAQQAAAASPQQAAATSRSKQLLAPA